MATALNAAARSTGWDVLTKLRRDVNQFVEEEIPQINGLRCEIIEIANDVGLAIDHVINAWDYAGILTKLADEVNGIAKEQITQLESMVADLKAKQPLVLVNLSSCAVSIIESLVLKGWQPKVLGLGLRYAWVIDGSFETSVSGRFKYAVSYPDTWSLDIPGYHIFRKKVEEGALAFKATTRYTAVTPEAKMKYCHFIKGTLEVKYNVGKFFTSLKSAKFELWFGTFPQIIGTIALTTSVRSIRQVRRTFVDTRSIHRESAQSGDEIIHGSIPIEPTPGWRRISKPKIQYAGKVKELEPIDGKIERRYLLKEGEDSVNVRVEFEEEQDLYLDVEKTEQIQLKWGKTYPFTATKFKLVLDRVDGTHFECDQPAKTKALSVIKLDGTYCLLADTPASK